ncbi:hypothetical protein SAY86_000982 [Trapa natans]|uniref:NAB domain-containing protein n=1 Tax=Trapa natans TaxID=22666 RepID=A0AAN7MBU6_TRANT|nr:hypothetical protein SAY86_000982 [Trapa natans]
MSTTSTLFSLPFCTCACLLVLLDEDIRASRAYLDFLSKLEVVRSTWHRVGTSEDLGISEDINNIGRSLAVCQKKKHLRTSNCRAKEGGLVKPSSDSIKSVFGSHIDPGRHEQLKGTIAEIEEKVKGILNRFSREDQEENDQIHMADFKKELFEIIDDLHKKYQSLYAQYDLLTGELEKRVIGKQSTDTSSSSSDEDEDSDDSSKKGNRKNAELRSSSQEIINELKLEVETVNIEVVELKTKLSILNKEKEALHAEQQAALSKIEEAENTMSYLRNEAERFSKELCNQSAENQKLNEMLGAADLVQIELRMRLEDMNREKEVLVSEKEAAARRIEEDLVKSQNLRNMIDELKDEKTALEQELKATEHRVSDLNQLQESMEQKLADLSFGACKKDMEEQLESKAAEVDDFGAQVKLLQGQKAELEARIVSYNDEASSQRSQLMDQINAVQKELEFSENKRKELELQLEKRTREVLELQIQIESLEAESGTREEDKQNLLEQKRGLIAQVKDLEIEVETLKLQSKGLEGERHNLSHEIEKLRGHNEELQNRVLEFEEMVESLHGHKCHLEQQLEIKARDISEFLIEVEKLKQDLASHAVHKHEMQQEKDRVTYQVKDLRDLADSLNSKKSQLEEHVESKTQEIHQLQEDNKKLQDMILRLEADLTLKGDEFAALSETLKQQENEASVHVMALEGQADSLRHELDSVQLQRNELESQHEKERREFSETLVQMENQKSELMIQLDNQHRLSKEQEEVYKKLSEDYEQGEHQLLKYKEILQLAESRKEETVRELQMKIVSHDQTVEELNGTVEGLKRDLDLKEDELSTLMENVRTIEVKLRLSNQKLRVTEQLLIEKEEIFRAAEAKYKQDITTLEERAVELSETVACNQRMFFDISEAVTSTMAGLESVVQKFKGECGKYSSCILHMSAELKIMKDCVRETRSAKHRLEEEVRGLIEQLKEKTRQESELRERLGKLGTRISEGEAEKEKLSITLKELQLKLKDKEEGALVLGEEKRESIRQLCIWIEYHRDRNNELREVLSKMRGATAGPQRG